MPIKNNPTEHIQLTNNCYFSQQPVFFHWARTPIWIHKVQAQPQCEQTELLRHKTAARLLSDFQNGGDRSKICQIFLSLFTRNQERTQIAKNVEKLWRF